MLEEYERIDNIKLIRNNLRHIDCELVSNKPVLMRVAKECHQLFSRMMVEALRGTANPLVQELWHGCSSRPTYLEQLQPAGREAPRLRGAIDQLGMVSRQMPIQPLKFE